MRKAKPVRSALFVPGNREDRIQKAPRFGADALILDLEDAVALPDKERARGTGRQWGGGWAGGAKRFPGGSPILNPGFPGRSRRGGVPGTLLRDVAEGHRARGRQ